MDNRNRDRGTLKWTSLMLPEHVEMIKQVWKEDERIEKPILDEQQWEEIGFKLQRALTDNLPVEIRFHNGFDYSDEKVKVVHLDPQNRKIKCIGLQDKLHTSFQVDDIMDVHII
ncbi:YolD-like family protein [Halobacillus litoralis]|uniref:YolD-like family protein n=1 Tax=Halobacillus litoralis TaxID=45668 RepID=A0A410MC92_9BACI|nr:YolD-like family protein [Halobacillus litoralis]QAS52359.1 YolD-like family protein [Halobacillus litoralis]